MHKEWCCYMTGGAHGEIREDGTTDDDCCCGADH